MKITAVIMAGGKGERFWPKSRENHPKQFLSLTHDGETMIQKTVNRISSLVETEDIFIVTNECYKEIVMQQLPNVPEENILLEPYRKNTAPCIAFATEVIKKKYDDAHKGDSTEKLHKAEYQYWFNRLSKAKRKNHFAAIADIEQAFAKFKEVSKIKKKQENNGLLSYEAYYGWCLEQRGVIDDIMMKHGLFDRG